jgi:DNA-binding CsgD family transcriptional regulator
LSQAEARLLEALVGGTRLGDYAARTGVSLSTVRTQLAQVFLKTGENRQSDLIRRVLRDLTLM